MKAIISLILKKSKLAIIVCLYTSSLKSIYTEHSFQVAKKQFNNKKLLVEKKTSILRKININYFSKIYP